MFGAYKKPAAASLVVNFKFKKNNEADGFVAVPNNNARKWKL